MKFVKQTKNNSKFLLVVLMFTAISLNYACKKQEDVSIDKINNGEISYLPMAVGKYWIYQISDIDENGDATSQGYDSTYISGTKEINGNSYFEFRSTYIPNYNQYFRDSASYIVNETGERFFCHKNDKDTLLNEKVVNFGYLIKHTYRVIHMLDKQVECVAGNFPAIEIRHSILYPLFNKNDISHFYYSPNIGIVLHKEATTLVGTTRVFSLMRWGK